MVPRLLFLPHCVFEENANNLFLGIRKIPVHSNELNWDVIVLILGLYNVSSWRVRVGMGTSWSGYELVWV